MAGCVPWSCHISQHCLCAYVSLRVAAAQAFYNGFLPNFARLGSWNVAMFLMLEQVSWLLSSTVLFACLWSTPP